MLVLGARGQILRLFVYIRHAQKQDLTTQKTIDEHAVRLAQRNGSVMPALRRRVDEVERGLERDRCLSRCWVVVDLDMFYGKKRAGSSS